MLGMISCLHGTCNRMGQQEISKIVSNIQLLYIFKTLRIKSVVKYLNGDQLDFSKEMLFMLMPEEYIHDLGCMAWESLSGRGFGICIPDGKG